MSIQGGETRATGGEIEMRYRCDYCGQEFEDDVDVDGDACNRCDEGTVELQKDMEELDMEEFVDWTTSSAIEKHDDAMLSVGDKVG